MVYLGKNQIVFKVKLQVTFNGQRTVMFFPYKFGTSFSVVLSLVSDDKMYGESNSLLW